MVLQYIVAEEPTPRFVVHKRDGGFGNQTIDVANVWLAVSGESYAAPLVGDKH
jgi:hypothetical protein